MTIISEFRVLLPFGVSIGICTPRSAETYSKCRGNRYGKVLPQKIHFRVQKMAKMNFLKTNRSNLAKEYINERGITKIA